MRVIYLDVFFLLNLWMNLLVLTVAGVLCRDAPSIIKMILAAVCGSVAACMALLVHRNWQLILLFPVAVLINWICYPHLPWRSLLGRTLLYIGVSVLLGGVINWWYFEIAGSEALHAGNVAILAGISTALLLLALTVSVRIRQRQRNVYKVLLSFHGHDVITSGFLDSGNLLTDALDRPVHILETAFLMEQCPEMEQYICGEQGRAEMFDVDYKSLGGDGHIRVMVCSRLMVPELGVDQRNVLVGLSEQSLFADGRCHMLLHSRLRQPGA